MNKWFKRVLITIASIAVIYVGYLVCVQVFATPVVVKENPPTVTLETKKVIHDPNLYGILQSVTRNSPYINYISIEYNKEPLIKNSKGIEAAGYYSFKDKEILINTLTIEDKINEVVAHEYLHYIWYTLSSNQKESITPLLNENYKSTSTLQARMTDYEQNKSFNYELFSIECTEYSNQITKPLLDTCNKYIDINQL